MSRPGLAGQGCRQYLGVLRALEPSVTYSTRRRVRAPAGMIDVRIKRLKRAHRAAERCQVGRHAGSRRVPASADSEPGPGGSRKLKTGGGASWLAWVTLAVLLA